jgi:hypothetical protein
MRSDVSMAHWLAAIGQTTGAGFAATAVGMALWLTLQASRWQTADQAERDTEQADRDAVQVRVRHGRAEVGTDLRSWGSPCGTQGRLRAVRRGEAEKQ